MTANDYWDMEQKFWLDGERHFREKMNGEAFMVFPSPVGILAGDEIVEAVKNAPRWDSVEFSQKNIRQSPHTTTLAYRAMGKRDGDPDYHALCSSTYVKSGDEWKMVLHQQTPTG